MRNVPSLSARSTTDFAYECNRLQCAREKGVSGRVVSLKRCQTSHGQTQCQPQDNTCQPFRPYMHAYIPAVWFVHQNRWCLRNIGWARVWGRVWADASHNPTGVFVTWMHSVRGRNSFAWSWHPSIAPPAGLRLARTICHRVQSMAVSACWRRIARIAARDYRHQPLLVHEYEPFPIIGELAPRVTAKAGGNRTVSTDTASAGGCERDAQCRIIILHSSMHPVE